MNRGLARFQNVRHKVQTNSSMNDLGLCEKLWYWKQVRRIEPAYSGVPRGLYMGSAFHRFQELRIVDADGDVMDQTASAINMAITRFPPKGIKDAEKVDGYNVDLISMMNAYVAWEQSEEGQAMSISKWATDVRTEVPWIARWTQGSQRVLAGVMDGFGWGVRAPIFLEHKGTSERDLYAFLGKLKVDPQILVYAWAIQAITGIAPEGVIYTITHNKAPKNLRFKKDGHLYAKAAATDRWTFEADLARAGRTLDSLKDYERVQYEQACRNKWTIREFWPITPEEIERWRHEADAKMKRMATIVRHPHLAVTNRHACRNMWGRDCPYVEMCSGRWVAPDLYRERLSAPEVEEALRSSSLLRKTRAKYR